MQGIRNVLIEGNACEPDQYDLIAQTKTIRWEETLNIPGWRILTGNNQYNMIGRIAYRYEIEADESDEHE
tara:strand:- start:215 stop:424 length:210 start_codon:yes stop_codon:yes gene_type:complete